jgi:glucosamine-6-phosphate deaminase
MEKSASTIGVEKVPVSVFPSAGAAGRMAATEIADLIRAKAKRGEHAVLGLATGSTPQGVYEELVRLHRTEGLSFKNVTTFNLDEYWPMQAHEIQSYRRFMREYLFDHIDINPKNVNVPDGTLAMAEVAKFCEEYERKIREVGGVDVQILGIGRTGHVGFNEPGSPRDSRTRLITLDKVTRMDASSDFFGEWNVPRKAITMGVGTILDAKRVVLLAFGEHKAGIVKRAVEGEITNAVAASFLQQHRDARFVLDSAAAAELTRFKTPWLLGPVEQFGLAWDAALTKRAVIWLATMLEKPILKLTDEDYNEHGMQDVLAARGGHRGGAYDINIEVFKSLQGTITGWPGGKPAQPLGSTALRAGRTMDETDERESALGASDNDRLESKSGKKQTHGSESRATQNLFPKRVVVFSPHPDDDVISMGGTFIRLCEQGHEVHVAYQTSGNIAVWDDTALRHADFVREFAHAFPNIGKEAADRIEAQVEAFVQRKKSGEVDSAELQKIKGLIRRSEARAGARYSGVKEENVHFLDLPFCFVDLLEKVKPQQVYAAGDLSDPHGTHRVCLACITTALHRLSERPWMKDCVVWLYRGAWQEWGIDEIEMAVPLAPDEVVRKRFAIFKHESQKDKALFPGPNDPREFWQRAEDRNRNTARLYDQLGLAEYEAIEGFVRWRPSTSDGSLVEVKATGAAVQPTKGVRR